MRTRPRSREIAAHHHAKHALWRARLALSAADACVGLAGRHEGAEALRDALHLLRPGDQPGPAGAIFRQWSRAVARPISVAALAAAIEGFGAERITISLDATGGNPMERAAGVIEAVLADTPRAETAG